MQYKQKHDYEFEEDDKKKCMYYLNLLCTIMINIIGLMIGIIMTIVYVSIPFIVVGLFLYVDSLADGPRFSRPVIG